MGVDALIPVEEALHVDGLAHLQVLHRRIHVGGVVAQVGLHGEGVGLAVVGGVEVQVIAVGAGAVPAVQEGGLVAAGILGGLHSQALEGDQLVLVVDEGVGAQQLGHVQRLGHEGVAALHDLEGAVHDLDLTGPLGLIAGDLDLGAGGQLVIVLLGAGHIIDEVGAVLVLGVQGGLVLPPGLLGLDIGLDGDLLVHRGGHILLVAHDLAGGLGAGGGGLGLRGGIRAAAGGILLAGVPVAAAAGDSQSHGEGQSQKNGTFHLASPFQWVWTGCPLSL